MPPDTRPQRKSIERAEWRVSARLVRIADRPEDDVELTRSEVPMRLSDARLNKEPADSGRAIALWIDDMAQKRARVEAAQKKAQKKR